MTDDPATTPLPGIAALPATTARLIGSGQVIVNASSIVKELIDNALDARAKSIFVDITANTVDSIQVKDDGHGIPAEDRALVCRRYCTSKIRDLNDLTNVGGRWLGFRGEALSSMAEMSGSLSVTTRVEGELVAVKLKYGRDGELSSTERDSHPVGTTVKATRFFETIPVRKQTAVKNAAKCLATIRRLMQAYALARPAVRFRLHVLRAKNNKADFIYAPKASSNVEDAALKVIGKDCALQCDWTVLESNDFEIHAFLPKPSATGPQIANHGAFISVDSRPVSHRRGTVKEIVNAFKERLRRSNTSTATVKDPFCCMNIICPPGSYDPNIEPAKDDVMFNHSEVVLGVVNKLLKSYYPYVTTEIDVEPPTSAQRPLVSDREALPLQDDASSTVHVESSESDRLPASEPYSSQLRWRSSMYGIDEDDLEHLQENQPPAIIEEEGGRSVAVSNPWTIARMNTPIKPKEAVVQQQLLSPAKSPGEGEIESSSLKMLTPPNQQSYTKPLTPKSASKMNALGYSLDEELERSIHQLPPHSSEVLPQTEAERGSMVCVDQYESSLSIAETTQSPFPQRDAGGVSPPRGEMDHESFSDPTPFRSPRLQSSLRPLNPNSSTRSQHVRAPRDGRLTVPMVEGPNDTWFGQSMGRLGASQPSKRFKRHREKAIPLLPDGNAARPRRPNLAAAERLAEDRLYSDNNTDIRDFFCQDSPRHTKQNKEPMPGPMLNAINRPSQSNQHRGRFAFDVDGDNATCLGHGQSRDLTNSPSGPPEGLSVSDPPHVHTGQKQLLSQPPFSVSASFELPLRSSRGRDALRNIGHYEASFLHGMSSEVRAHSNGDPQSTACRSASAGSESQPTSPRRSHQISTALDLYGRDKVSSNARDMVSHFKAYQDRELASSDRSASPLRGQRLRIAPEHVTPAKPLPQRRRTTEGAQGTKSSQLPLERVPHGYQIQNLSLSMSMGVAIMVQSSHKLDMARNSLEWGCPAESVYEAFAEPVPERKVMEWVNKLDTILHEHYGRKPGTDTCSVLHEAIQRKLDACKADDTICTVEVVEAQPTKEDVELAIKTNENVDIGSLRELRSTPKTEEDMSSFDMSQFVDFDTDKSGHSSVSIKDAFKMTEGDYGDGIEDDMLLDL